VRKRVTGPADTAVNAASRKMLKEFSSSFRTCYHSLLTKIPGNGPCLYVVATKKQPKRALFEQTLSDRELSPEHGVVEWLYFGDTHNVSLDNPDHYFDSAFNRRITDVALQHWMGLLSRGRRWARVDYRDHSHRTRQNMRKSHGW
jgi:hypothetical protein